MALNLEDLKVGESYLCEDKIHYNKEVLVLCIGEHKVFCTEIIGGINYSEILININTAIKDFSLKPKPKKVIELVTFLHSAGGAREVLHSSEHYSLLTEKGYTRISSRTVECE